MSRGRYECGHYYAFDGTPPDHCALCESRGIKEKQNQLVAIYVPAGSRVQVKPGRK